MKKLPPTLPNNNKTASLISLAAGLLLSAGAAAADYTPSSILASGQWVKVHVDSSSVYRIDYPTLRQWGFPEPEKVMVFGYGSVEQAHQLDTAPDDLPPVPVRHTADALYFYAEGDRRTTPSNTSALLTYRNFYSTGSNYFLTVSHEGREIAESDIESAATPVNTHTSIDLRLPEEVNFHSASTFFFSKNLPNTPGGISFSFSAPDFSANAYLAYRYIYLHDEDESQYLGVSFSGPVTATSFSPTYHKQNTVENRLFSFATLKKISLRPSAPDPFKIHFEIPAGKSFKKLAFSEVYFMYSRLNRFKGPVMAMDFIYNQSSPLPVNLGELAGGTEIWDVTSPREACRLVANVSESGESIVTIPAHTVSGRRLCLFSPDSKLPVPTLVGSVSSRNLHALPSTDYLIVTTETLRSEAERLAAAHRSIQGLDVTVVTQDEVFNEFSSGSSHPNGLRKFVRMLRERPDRPLRYLLLMGASSYDPRKLLSDDGIEYLVGYEVERSDYAASTATDYATDLYFGFMSDRINENLPATYTEIPISIGRAPVMTLDEAHTFVDKSIAYLNDPRLAGRPDLAVLVACEGDKDAHLNGAETLRSDILKRAPFTTCSRIYNALYPFDKTVERYPTFAPMASQIARGPFLLNYTGHSGAYQLGSVISVPKISNLTFSSMPIVYLSSCDTSPIDNFSRGIGTEFFLLPSGPIAVVGSGRDVYLSNNHALNEEFARRLVQSDGPERLGDVWRTAINTTALRGATQRVNNFCYNFIADPALPVRRPDRNVRLSLPETATDDNGPISLPSLSQVELQGSITDKNGNIDTDFNGSLQLSLYEAPHTVQRYIHAKGDSAKMMTLDENLLAEVSAEVINGQWKASLTPPLTSRSGRNRLTMLAYSTEGQHIACGIDSSFTVRNPLEASAPDTTAPQIELYINSPDTPDGSETHPSPVLYARMRDDESGLASGAANIGNIPKAFLDSYTELSDFGNALQFNSDGSAEIVYPLSNLSEGRHSVTMSVRDVAGNTARQTVTFTVVDTPLSATLLTDSLIARESIELDLSRPATTECRLIIRNQSGHTVLSRSGISFPFSWDFRDNDGNSLPDGTYRAAVILSDGIRIGSTPETSFTLIRHKY